MYSDHQNTKTPKHLPANGFTPILVIIITLVLFVMMIIIVIIIKRTITKVAEYWFSLVTLLPYREQKLPVPRCSSKDTLVIKIISIIISRSCSAMDTLAIMIIRRMGRRISKQYYSAVA